MAPTPKDLRWGVEMSHPTWGDATVIGPYDDTSWEVRNRKGHTLIRVAELPEWRITYCPPPVPHVPDEEV